MSHKIFVLLFSILFISCSSKNYSHSKNYQFKSANGLPNYQDLNYWAAHPWKKDLSDSIPEALRYSFQYDSLADVFFVHPTTLTSLKDDRWNADIDDAEINAKTDYSPILYQASVFNEKTRVFAPRYRQAHIKSFYKKGVEADQALELAYTDVKTAFLFYLQNYNNGRPIIIASHSQGTKHTTRLLKEFFENKPLQKQLVCAYLLGLSVPVDYFTDINTCADPTATGCIISWRIFKSGSIEPEFIANENYNSIVVNPLSWATGTELISAQNNLGGVLKNFKKIVPGVVNAQIHNNILWSSKPDIPGKIFFTRTNYHIGDINLFYVNIRKNVEQRITAFLNSN